LPTLEKRAFARKEKETKMPIGRSNQDPRGGGETSLGECAKQKKKREMSIFETLNVSYTFS